MKYNVKFMKKVATGESIVTMTCPLSHTYLKKVWIPPNYRDSTFDEDKKEMVPVFQFEIEECKVCSVLFRPRMF